MEKEKDKELKLEEIFTQLEAVTAKLESGDLSLEESFASYEAGIKLVKAAESRSDLVVKKIRILSGEEEE